MADDDNDSKVISFADYRRKLRGPADDENNPITQLFKKDLREQQDLIDWYTFHRTFNRLKLFVHCLLQHNQRGANLNTGFVALFDDKQFDRVTKQLEEALHWAGRKSVILDAAGKTQCQLAEALTGRPHRTRLDAYNSFRHVLLRTDTVVVVREISASKLGANKPGAARSFIKILDDAHFDEVTPRGDLIFIDRASFLEKAWSMIGIYLNIVTA